MFQGTTYRIKQLSKNRYEFRSPLTLQYGTYQEMVELITQHMKESQRSTIELSVAKLELKKMAEQDGLELSGNQVPAKPAEPIPAPKPVQQPPEPIPPGVPDPTPSVPDVAPAPIAPSPDPIPSEVTRVRARARSHQVNVVGQHSSDAAPRRTKQLRSNKNYLMRLLEEEAQQSAAQ